MITLKDKELRVETFDNKEEFIEFTGIADGEFDNLAHWADNNGSTWFLARDNRDHLLKATGDLKMTETVVKLLEEKGFPASGHLFG